MKWQHTDRSRRDYRAAPPEVQEAFDKQVHLLSQDVRHPFLRSKKYAGSGVWQVRVNRK